MPFLLLPHALAVRAISDRGRAPCRLCIARARTGDASGGTHTMATMTTAHGTSVIAVRSTCGSGAALQMHAYMHGGGERARGCRLMQLADAAKRPFAALLATVGCRVVFWRINSRMPMRCWQVVPSFTSMPTHRLSRLMSRGEGGRRGRGHGCSVSYKTTKQSAHACCHVALTLPPLPASVTATHRWGAAAVHLAVRARPVSSAGLAPAHLRWRA